MSDVNDLSELNFDDLTPKAIPVRIAGKQYVLREASEDAAIKYRNAMTRAMKFGPDGKPQSVGDVADADSLLLSLCLFELASAPGGTAETPVPPAAVRSWPARVVAPLVERLKTISELEQRDTPDTLAEKINRLKEQRDRLLASKQPQQESPEKNGLAATTGTSV